MWPFKRRHQSLEFTSPSPLNNYETGQLVRAVTDESLLVERSSGEQVLIKSFHSYGQVTLQRFRPFFAEDSRWLKPGATVRMKQASDGAWVGIFPLLRVHA